MTSPETSDTAARLRSAIAEALAAGISRQEIFAMVSTVPLQPHSRQGDALLYDETPAGLISLPDAARKYKLRNNTLNVAMHRGLLTSAGYIKGRGGGGYRHLVSEAALRHYLKLPPEEDPPKPVIRVLPPESDFAQ